MHFIIAGIHYPMQFHEKVYDFPRFDLFISE